MKKAIALIALLSGTAFAQVQLGRNVQIGGAGAGSGCPTGTLTPNGQMIYNDAGNCTSSPNILVVTPSNTQDPLLASDEIQINNVHRVGGFDDDINLYLQSGVDPTNNYSWFAPHYWNMNCTNSGLTTLGCGINFTVDDSGTPTSSTGGLNTINITMSAAQAGAHPGYSAMLVTQNGGTISPTVPYLGIGLVGPNSGTYRDATGYSIDTGQLTTTGGVFGKTGYLALFHTGATIASDYCAFKAADDGGTSFFSKIECGPTHTSTFFGPTTFQAPVSVADGTGTAGLVAISQGTAASTAANSIGFTAPTSVTAYNMTFPAAQWTGLLSNNGSGVLSGISILPVANGGTGTATPGIVAGTNVTVTGTWPNQTVNSTGGGSSAFSALTSSTNTTAAMLVGSGASLAPTGTGTIQATNIAGTLSAGSGIGVTGSGTVASPYVVTNTGGGSATTIASSETVASSATPTFSTSFNVSYTVLTANVTTFTLPAGSDGQSKTLTFCQNGTGGFTVTPPANVHGFFTVSPTASKCNSQHYNYSTAQTAWLADSAGVIGE